MSHLFYNNSKIYMFWWKNRQITGEFLEGNESSSAIWKFENYGYKLKKPPW